MKDNLQAVIFLIKFSIGICIICFFALLFGTEIQSWVSPPSVNTPLSIPEEEAQKEDVEEGIHLATGLIFAEGFNEVRANCTGCHSAKMITQNRATREGWEQMIDWMQRTQGLWELGERQEPILAYLAQHYAPEKVGRRAPLNVEEIDWYVLELE